MADAIRTTDSTVKVYEIKDTIPCDVCGDVMDLQGGDEPFYECRNPKWSESWVGAVSFQVSA